MSILVIGSLMWAVVLLLAARLARAARPEGGASPARRIVWCALLAGAAVVLLRPHEDILGGQDTGAYANAAAIVGRLHALSYDDPMLAQLKPASREPFVIRKWYDSKYHLLWLPDSESPTMAPWFQPAFSILAGTVAWPLGPKAILFVTPLFALLTGLALAALARRMLDHPWAAEIAFWFYTTLPLVVWHARFTRPEIVASALLFGGAALLADAARSPRWTRTPDILLGSVALCAAPFFHMLSSASVLAAALVVIVLMLRGRDDFAVFPFAGAALLGIFLFQTYHITDTYSLRRLLAPLAPHGALLLSLVALAPFILYALSAAAARRRARTPDLAPEADERFARRLCAAAAVIVPAAFVAVYVVAFRTDPEQLKKGALAYVHRTDLRAAAGMLSPAIAVLALIGTTLLALPRAGRPATRVAFLALAVPASLTIGNMYDFFMTRYMTPALLPLAAVGLAALVARIRADRRAGAIATVLAVIAINGLALHGRLRLVTVREYKGLTDYVERIAKPLKEKNAMVLFEYPRIAAPFDLFFGLDVLPLGNDRTLNYWRAERLWAKLMQRNPDRPAYFITPFDRFPAFGSFRFTPVGDYAFEGPRVISRRWGLPRETGAWGCRLRVYRMTPRDAPGEPQPLPLPLHIGFGDGNTGLRGFRLPEIKGNITAKGLELRPGEDVLIPTADAARERGAELWLIALHAPGDGGELRVIREGAPEPVTQTRLADDWHLARIPVRDNTPVTIESAGRILLVSIHIVSPTRIKQVLDGWESATASEWKVPAFSVRWAAQNAHVILPPTPPDIPRVALAYGAVPEELGDRAEICLVPCGAYDTFVPSPAGRFYWGVFPLGELPPACVRIRSQTPADAPPPADATIAIGLGHLVIAARETR